MEVAIERVRLAGHGGAEIDGLLARPATGAEPLPALVVAGVAPGTGSAGLPGVAEAVERLAALGCVALAPDLARGAGAEALPDRRAVADLEAAAAFLAGHPAVDAERVGAFGSGAAGTLAFLLGCQSRRVEAVVDWGGPIVYPDLSGDRPVQPLEMALNLSAPLLAVHAEDDPAVPAADVDALERTLAQFAKSFELVRVPTWDGAATAAAWSRTSAFLAECLGLSGDQAGN